MAERCAEETPALLLLEEMRCLTRTFREIRDRDADYFACGRVPFERKSIALGAADVVEIGAGFWVWVESGGSANVDMTWNAERDAGEARYRFTLSTGSLWPFPFAKGQVNIPSGETGTMVLVIGRFPVPQPPQMRDQLIDETGTLISATNPLDVTLRTGTNVSQNVSLRDVTGTAQTARDWSGDLDNLQGIPPDLSGTARGARLKVEADGIAAHRDRTTTALGASATFTGAANSTLVNSALSELPNNTVGRWEAALLAAASFANVSGTLRFLVGIVDAITFDTLRDAAVSASTAIREQQSMIGSTTNRIDFVNGATGQTTFRHQTTWISQIV